MTTNTSYYFDLGANNTVAADTISSIMFVLLDNAGTQISFNNENLDSVRNQLKSAMRAALAFGSISQLAMGLDRSFSSRVNEEEQLKEMYASFAKEQSEAEQLAMAQYNCPRNNINLIELPYIAVRMMVVSFLKKYSDQVIDEAFDYDPDTFEKLITMSYSKRYHNQLLSDKCLQRLARNIEDSIEYLKVADAQ